MASKNYKLKANQIVQLIEPIGGCIATDKITVDGELVDYMFHGEAHNNLDSGWQFFLAQKIRIILMIQVIPAYTT